MVVFCPELPAPAAARAASSRSAAPTAARRRRRSSSGRELELVALEIETMSREPRLVEVRKNVLKQNDVVARELRQSLPRRRRLRREPGVEPGRRQDDAARAHAHAAPRPASRGGAGRRPGHGERRGPPGAQPARRVRQITTGTVCHLEAAMVAARPGGLGAGRARLAVRRERRQPGVPGVVRPGGGPAVRGRSPSPRARTSRSSIPRSSTPPTSRSSPRLDLAEAAGFDWPAALANIQAVRPGMRTLGVSAKTGEGMAGSSSLLEAAVLTPRGVAVAGGQP